jgi:hypothetical protein
MPDRCPPPATSGCRDGPGYLQQPSVAVESRVQGPVQIASPPRPHPWWDLRATVAPGCGEGQAGWLSPLSGRRGPAPAAPLAHGALQLRRGDRPPKQVAKEQGPGCERTAAGRTGFLRISRCTAEVPRRLDRDGECRAPGPQGAPVRISGLARRRTRRRTSPRPPLWRAAPGRAWRTPGRPKAVPRTWTATLSVDIPGRSCRGETRTSAGPWGGRRPPRRPRRRGRSCVGPGPSARPRSAAGMADGVSRDLQRACREVASDLRAPNPGARRRPDLTPRQTPGSAARDGPRSSTIAGPAHPPAWPPVYWLLPPAPAFGRLRGRAEARNLRCFAHWWEIPWTPCLRCSCQSPLIR